MLHCANACVSLFWSQPCFFNSFFFLFSCYTVIEDWVKQDKAKHNYWCCYTHCEIIIDCFGQQMKRIKKGVEKYDLEMRGGKDVVASLWS